MPSIQEAPFDKLAFDYDRLWSTSAAGIAQRLAVWRWLDSVFKTGESVLDLGCGTGIDALHLQASDVSVYGIDNSLQMIEVSRRRGINAHCLCIEDLDRLDMRFDGAISNFGALNCVASLSSIASALAEIVRPGGHVVLCLLGRVCLWELIYYVRRRNPRKAFRRLGGWAKSSFGVQVFYPTKTQIVSVFRPYFRLLKSCGIGLFVSPSYVTNLPDEAIQRMSEIDRKLAYYPVLRSLADHHLYVFERV